MAISREKQIEILRKMSDEDIDYSDIPPITKEQFLSAKPYLPPEKTAITIRIDSDLLEWFKQQQPKGYQTFINAVLREYVGKSNIKP
jgi:uncharacterized protein (DUF4415 family)